MPNFPTFKKIPVHLWVAVSAWGSRIVIGLIQLITVRVLLVGLGADRYAVYVLLTSLIGWYSLADMGVGLSLMNYISEQRARQESYGNYVIMATIITLLEFVIGIVVLYGLSLAVAPLFLKQFSFLPHAEKIGLFFMSGIILFSTALCSLIYRIWYAEQKGYLANIVPAVTSLLGLGSAWLVLQSTVVDKLYWSLLAYILPALIVGSGLFIIKAVSLSTGTWRFDQPIFASLMKRALRFFGFALLGLVITQIDYFILSQTVKAHEIIAYNIIMKLYSFAFTIYAAVLAAWHPVNCEMYVRQEFGKIKNHTMLYVLSGIGGMSLFTAGLFLFMPYLIKVFSPQEIIAVPGLFIFLSGVYFVIRVWNDTFVTLLVSMNKFRQMFIMAPLQIAISAPMQILLARKLGIYGIPSGLIIAYLLTSVWFLPRIAWKFIATREEQYER